MALPARPALRAAISKACKAAKVAAKHMMTEPEYSNDVITIIIAMTIMIMFIVLLCTSKSHIVT